MCVCVCVGGGGGGQGKLAATSDLPMLSMIAAMRKSVNYFRIMAPFFSTE